MSLRRKASLPPVVGGRRPKVAVITCYFAPDYVRGAVIREAIARDQGWTVLPLVNRNRGFLRYAEIAVRLIALRLRERPDLYVLTFRGQELLPFVLFVAGRAPVVFDEFIVPIAYATGEAHRRSPAIIAKHAFARLTRNIYPRWLAACSLILADTAPHAELSAHHSGVPADRYEVLPVGADETVFDPSAPAETDTSGDFLVLYYGNMLPLHGLETVLKAAELLRDEAGIGFLFVGGGAPAVALCEAAEARGARVSTLEWVEYRELPALIRRSALCLGGPFGNTPQAQHVVTGKTYQFLACGAPTLIGAGEASEVFTDGVDCLIVPQGDPRALAEKIRWAASHRAELGRIGSRGRELYRERFSTDVLARRLDERLHRLLPGQTG